MDDKSMLAWMKDQEDINRALLAWIHLLDSRATTAQATQIAPTEGNPSDADLCRYCHREDGGHQLGCPAASTSQKTQASSQSATKTDDAGLAEPDYGCAHAWGRVAQGLTGIDNLYLESCQKCPVYRWYGKILAPLVQPELSTLNRVLDR